MSDEVYDPLYDPTSKPIPHEPRVVMQPRCIFCLREQYGLAVYLVSLGVLGCSWCGRIPPQFDAVEDYRRALAARRKEKEDELPK